MAETATPASQMESEKPPAYTENSQYGGGAAPPMGFIPVITEQPQTHTVVLVPVNFGHSSVMISCPHCNAQVSTTTEPETGSCTHLAACILCCFVCWPFAWVPYCMDGCKDTIHTCPSCGNRVGHAPRL